MSRGIQQIQDPHMMPPTRRIMVFIDGENLVARYQDMISNGFMPRKDMIHIKDEVVWFSSFTHLAREHDILRATYYTYVTGDEKKLVDINRKIRELRFEKNRFSLLPDRLTPCIFKKENKSRSAKGVDIQICVDVLNHVYRKNIDAVLLLSGDGDYEPLIDEVLRNGVQVYLSAFSSGLNPRLRHKVDRLYELDGTTWAPNKKMEE